MKNKPMRYGKILWTVVGVIATLLGLAFNGQRVYQKITESGWFIDDKVIALHPSTTDSHEQLLIGTYLPIQDRILRIYVHPNDGTGNYWTQIPRTEPGGVWSYIVRLGNPCWRSMIGRPPLKFDIFAALFKPAAHPPGDETAPLQIASGVDFSKWLREQGATAISHSDITRIEQQQRCNFVPRIVHPVMPTNSCESARVTGDFELQWEPARPLWVELWKDGSGVSAYPNAERQNGTRFLLPTGLYEFKVKEAAASPCGSSFWIDVVQ